MQAPNICWIQLLTWGFAASIFVSLYFGLLVWQKMQVADVTLSPDTLPGTSWLFLRQDWGLKGTEPFLSSTTGMTWLRISDSKPVSSLKSLLKIHLDGKLLLKSIIRAIWKHFIHSIIIIILWWAVLHNFLTFLSKTMNRLIDNENKRLLQPYWKVCDSVLSRVFNLTWVLTGLRLDWDY